MQISYSFCKNFNWNPGRVRTDSTGKTFWEWYNLISIKLMIFLDDDNGDETLVTLKEMLIKQDLSPLPQNSQCSVKDYSRNP